MAKIIVDSSCEFNTNITNLDVSTVPFKITMDDVTYIDDDNLDMQKFYEDMRNSDCRILTSCPSPDDFLKHMEGDEIFIITITSQLSGSYNSAEVAKKMYLEKNPNANVHIFDSKSASAGETGILKYITDLINDNFSFDDIVNTVEGWIDKTLTIFALNSFTNLARNGRIPKFAGTISKFLSMKAIARNKDGKISLLSIERGAKKAINQLVEKAVKLCDKTLDTPIIISEANDENSAIYVKDLLSKNFPNRIIEITKMKALSSTYAEEGGIIIFI